MGLAAADGDDDFDFVAFLEAGLFVFFAEDDLLVAFDGVGGGFDFAQLDEAGDGGAGGDFVIASVENDLHGGIITAVGGQGLVIGEEGMDSSRFRQGAWRAAISGDSWVVRK